MIKMPGKMLFISVFVRIPVFKSIYLVSRFIHIITVENMTSGILTSNRGAEFRKLLLVFKINKYNYYRMY